MAKKSKQKRKEADERREEDRAAVEVARTRQTRLRIAAVVVPLVAIAAALGVFFGTDDKQLAALIGMIGLALWVPTLLGLLGGQVPPRDRTRAGSIDFGNKR
jgi:hypothetical protein